MISLIRFYQKYLSPQLRVVFGDACRYQPTCSEYAVQAIQKEGTFKGSYLAFKRFLSCNSFHK